MDPVASAFQAYLKTHDAFVNVDQILVPKDLLASKARRLKRNWGTLVKQVAIELPVGRMHFIMYVDRNTKVVWVVHDASGPEGYHPEWDYDWVNWEPTEKQIVDACGLQTAWVRTHMQLTTNVGLVPSEMRMQFIGL